MFDRLRRTTGLTDAEIARAIGIEPTELGRLRRRGRVPYKALVAATAAGALVADLHWVLTGQLAPRTPNSELRTPNSEPRTPNPELPETPMPTTIQSYRPTRMRAVAA